LSYGALWQAAAQVASELVQEGVKPGDRIGLLGIKTVHDFEHLLGIWLAGAAYVPLNHKFPAARNREILAAAGARGVLVGPHSIALAKEIGASPAQDGASAYYRVDMADVIADDEAQTADLAYILFTSGTTGAPKGVPISFANLGAYLSNLQSVYPAFPSDRMAQLADLSFDASIHEIAWCWLTGATLYVVPASGALMWPRYAREHRMTVMLVVPSAVVLAARARLLGPDALPGLRLAFMGAELLTHDVVHTMRAAAPHARLVNLWGPTESTVAFTHFPLDTSRALPDPIPIGFPFPGQLARLHDAQDGKGELVQAGNQVMRGYWRNPNANRERFIDDGGQRWYRSGDLARFDDELGFIYCGRVDRQVKIRGYRVELLECEAAIRSASGCDQVAVVPVQPEGSTTAEALACFLAGPRAIDAAALKIELRKRLPDYMLPASFEQLDSLPLGANGKTDYTALRQWRRASLSRS
jgi:amino acid adenylation domain-containing protein